VACPYRGVRKRRHRGVGQEIFRRNSSQGRSAKGL
jgi:hypothetical protein